MAIEHENEIADWMKSFDALPDEKKDLLYRWFAQQKIIIEHSGLRTDEWFGYVQWAMENPFDYSFVLDFPDKGDANGTSDNARPDDETRKARVLVGAGGPKAALASDGPSIKDKVKSERPVDKELFDRFMAERMNKGRK